MTASALIIGYGSIGRRHARILTELGCETAVLSHRQIEFSRVYNSLPSALEDHKPDYVVVANATSQHYQTLGDLALLKYAGRILIEKPLFESVRDISRHHFSDILVGYNLRFHPVLQKIMELLKGEMVLSVNAYVGQYLPDWRPSVDYRQSYSAKVSQGGGVLRDLSHELDYLGMLFGRWQRVTALGGHFSQLEIDSDDVFSLLYYTDHCPALSLQMNYLDRPGQRCLTINTAAHTIQADLHAATVKIDGSIIAHYDIARDTTYSAMHQAILGGETQNICSLAQGLETMRLIEAAEAAVQQGVWISR